MRKETRRRAVGALIVPFAFLSPSSQPYPLQSEALTPSQGSQDPRTTLVLEQEQKAEATRNDPTGCGNNGKKILFTFDDWSYAPTQDQSRERLQKYVAALNGQRTNGKKEEPVGAVFFPINQFVQDEWPGSVDYLRREKFYVGNHSWSHPMPFETMSRETIASQIQNGVDSTIFRAPGGGVNQTVRSEAKKQGKRICGWTIDSEDYTGITAKEIEQKVLSRLQPGAVVLMHLNGSSHSLEAIQGGIIEKIKEKGYAICSKPHEQTTATVPEQIC